MIQGPMPKMREQKQSSSPFLMPYGLHIFEVSKFATCWTRRDLLGSESTSAVRLNYFCLPAGPGTHRL